MRVFPARVLEECPFRLERLFSSRIDQFFVELEQYKGKSVVYNFEEVIGKQDPFKAVYLHEQNARTATTPPPNYITRIEDVFAPIDDKTESTEVILLMVQLFVMFTKAKSPKWMLLLKPRNKPLKAHGVHLIFWCLKQLSFYNGLTESANIY